MDSRPLLSVTGLSMSFGAHTVLDDMDFGVARGEKVCLVGPSGSGKSTLLRCLNLLTIPTAGTLTFEDETVFCEPESGARTGGLSIREYRTCVGMVFQQFQLFPHLTVAANVALGPRHVLGRKREEALRRGTELLDRVGLADHAHKHPAQLSGGQQQRVAIARSMAMDPKVILFDEPTSALDPEMSAEVIEIMAQLAAAGMTMVVVTHDMALAQQVADRIVVMDDAHILEEGEPQQVIHRPQHPRTAQIMRIRMTDDAVREVTDA
jgi:ABC-type polar amino acid transport system ATPase subunit